MRGFSERNPIAVTVYFLSVCGTAMFCMNPVLLFLSLVGAVALFAVRNGRRGVGTHVILFVTLIAASLINPLFYHNGETVLFVLNDSPITLEATVYGAAAAVMMVSVLYWFRSFTQIMTSDKLLYLFGRISPKLSLVLSMTLRFIPLFAAQARRVNAAQRAAGLYKDDNIADSVRGGIRVFSVMVTWALENGITTADSMTARGYGIGRRTSYSIFRFGVRDAALVAVTLVLLGITLTGAALGALDFVYYPALTPPPFGALSLAACISYGALALLPAISETEDKLRWKFLRSKI